MKTLVIARHAKAEGFKSSETDFDRKLTDSGKEDAVKMSLLLFHLGVHPHKIVSSTAKRTWSTAKKFSKAFNIEEQAIIPQHKIYNANIDTLIDLVHNFDNKWETVILVGHNPGVSNLASYFTGDSTLELPTCSVVIVEFESDDWQWCDYKKGRLVNFIKP